MLTGRACRRKARQALEASEIERAPAKTKKRYKGRRDGHLRHRRCGPNLRKSKLNPAVAAVQEAMYIFAYALFRTPSWPRFGISILLVEICFRRKMRHRRSSSLKIDLNHLLGVLPGKQSSMTD
jgi:hypothetical protein